MVGRPTESENGLLWRGRNRCCEMSLCATKSELFRLAASESLNRFPFVCTQFRGCVRFSLFYASVIVRQLMPTIKLCCAVDNNFFASQGNDPPVHHRRRPHFPLEKSNINAISIGTKDIECRMTSIPAGLDRTLIGPNIMMINRRLQFARSFHNIASDFAGLIVYMRQLNG